MSQNKKVAVRFGIIGFGHIGKIHAENVSNNPSAELVAISKKSQLTETEKNLKMLQNVKFYSDWKDLIKDEEIDAVIIATPTNTHAEISIYAAYNKKHIFLEKPMANNFNDCISILEAASKNKVVLFIGHVLRFWPTYVFIKNYYCNKRRTLGNLKFTRLERLSSGPSWSNWFFDESLSGGVILDLSIHDIDYAIWLINKKPQKIHCNLEYIKKDKWKTEVPAISETTLWFKSGEIAQCRASWAENDSFPFTMKGTLLFQKGLIYFNENLNPPIKIYSEKEIVYQIHSNINGYYEELNSFIRSLNKNKSPEVKGIDGLISVAVCLAAIKSAKENRIVDLNSIFPKKIEKN